ncbi:MAG: diguanylate cyclase [Rhizorhabdus sp.]|nr:diguanylate cyclase [Rhizorhabdus sp.]
MNAALLNIVALQFIAAMLAAIMLIAWRSFDRPRHALIWAVAFSVATAGWFFNFIARFWAIDSPLLLLLATALSCLFNALIAIGFVRRSRNDARVVPLLAAAACIVLVVALFSFVVPHEGLRDGSWLAFDGAMLAISAREVARTLRVRSLPERATTLMFVLFALVHFGLAALALEQGAVRDDGGLNSFRLALLLLFPPSFIGIGLFTFFLVAADLAERMRALAVSDLLTGILNRRGFEEAAEGAIRNAQRQHQPLTLVVTDIDRFKAINDRYGHVAGDRAIQHFASRMARMVRRGDLIGRIGGEEFALLLINTRSMEAMEVVERIRADVSALPVDGPESIHMTASFGVTDLRVDDVMLANLFARADRALYRAKIDGRDRIVCAETMDPTMVSPDRIWVTSDPV